MNKKLRRVLNEIRKTEKKIATWQEHLGELNVQREMLEDAEILKSVHSMRLGSWELLSVLEGIQQGTVVFSEKPGTDMEFAGEKSTEPEELAGSAESMTEITENTAEITENIAEELSAGQSLPEDGAAEREDLYNER